MEEVGALVSLSRLSVRYQISRRFLLYFQLNSENLTLQTEGTVTSGAWWRCLLDSWLVMLTRRIQTSRCAFPVVLLNLLPFQIKCPSLVFCEINFLKMTLILGFTSSWNILWLMRKIRFTCGATETASVIQRFASRTPRSRDYTGFIMKV